ncbi:cytoplasmic dynein 1 light intermediate chain 2-like isoform X1 [Biomphalaria glabrata]|uniref:Dynein light intermediate chain n=1 Tax=Biomphalaria glabrata TaxID=6526 RepID=A0A2C9JP05_BIOGL|nr:cytoplasmic dynein 1 light intermediate chain 2-like isoform X1 [Biomphalaria glabrata]KAI8762360.1 cytoplasmic dynein 1 light intermediate chain 2-like isoform X1 [Biomphalaria glabrata]KAI8790093.1 cytoplasmic dynein 1 light intermediate chain 2 isoform X1 [Biomphalaria glabrata]
MAPIIEKEDKMGNFNEESSTDDSENLWADILSEVQSGSASKLPTTRTVLVLGDNDSGKTTLIAKLQGLEEPKKGSGLEYYYIDVKDEYRDEQARLNVWVLDGDPHHTGLLKYALKEDSFSDTLVMLVVSMAQPWALLETLTKWADVLRDHVDKLRIPADKLQEYEQSLIRVYQAYTEPGDGPIATQGPPRGDINPLHPPPSGSEEESVLPLGELTLSKNLGIPIVVVVTKSDTISMLEKDFDYKDEHLDFIQQHIRKFCLKYGAAMFYTSVKDERNCDLLYRYLVHRIYGFPFTSPALVVDKDSVFVPSGWDNEKKISILYDNMTSMKPDDTFEDIITKPSTRKVVQRDAEVTAEDDQAFLAKQQLQLSKQTATPGTGTPPPAAAQESPVPRLQRPQVHKTPERSPAPANAGTPVRGKDGKPQAGNTTEGMLANFFNSLLSKTPGQPGPNVASMTGAEHIDKAAVSRDAAAELERMTKGKKSIDTNNTSTDSAEPQS